MTTPISRRLQAVRTGASARQPRERLAFNLGPGTVPSRHAAEGAIAADAEPTFATAPYAEPRDWGYWGLLAFTAVLLLRPQDQIRALSPLHLAEVTAVLGIAPMMLHRFAHRLPVFRITSETTGIILFGLVIVATSPFSIWPGGALEVFTDSYLKIAIVFVLMMNTLTTAKRLEQLTWLILLCCGFIAGRAVFDYARGINLVEDGRLAGPISGMFGNPNDLALNMVTFMPAAAIVALTRHHSMIKRLTAGAIVALMLAVVVFTKSRGGALGLIVMLAALVILGRRVRPGFGVIAVIGVLLAVPFMPQSFWMRMASMTDENVDKREFTGSSEARRIVMNEGIDTFVEFPLTGVGAGQFKNYNPPQRRERWREAHNVLIQVASETGLAGLLVFGFLIVRAALAAATTRRMLSRTKKNRGSDPLRLVMSEADRRAVYSHTVAMTAGLIGWFVCAMFASVAYNWTFYYLLALIVAARELTRERLAAGTAIEHAHARPDASSAAIFSPRIVRGLAL
jgi:O-antigen ligase